VLLLPGVSTKMSMAIIMRLISILCHSLKLQNKT